MSYETVRELQRTLYRAAKADGDRRFHSLRDKLVACEPTGHRWRVVVEQASRLGLEAVCVQPLLVRRAREAEDFTHDKSDDKDALLIARLVTQLHCYLPERPTAAWARLRHLGNRRVEQLAHGTAAQQRLRTCWSVAGRRPWRWPGIRLTA